LALAGASYPAPAVVAASATEAEAGGTAGVVGGVAVAAARSFVAVVGRGVVVGGAVGVRDGRYYADLRRAFG
jgi:hypothetical protein